MLVHNKIHTVKAIVVLHTILFSTYIQHSIIKARSKVVVINLQTWKLKILHKCE